MTVTTGRNDWVSVHGRSATSVDSSTIARLWSPAAGAFFDGRDDDNLMALQVSLLEGDFWSAPGGGSDRPSVWRVVAECFGRADRGYLAWTRPNDQQREGTMALSLKDAADQTVHTLAHRMADAKDRLDDLHMPHIPYVASMASTHHPFATHSRRSGRPVVKVAILLVIVACVAVVARRRRSAPNEPIDVEPTRP